MTNPTAALAPNQGSLTLPKSQLSRLHQRLAAYLDKRRQIATTIFELSALDDRELADLGIARCDIRTIAKQTVQDGQTKRG